MGRFIIGAFFGAIVTVALAYFMQMLIFTDTTPLPDVDETPVIIITMERPVEDSPRTPPAPPGPEDQPPPPPRVDPSPTELPALPIPAPTLPGIEIEVNPGAFARMLTPIYRVPPEYPSQEQQRGVEGYAVIVFCVATDGRTSGINVAESSPTSSFGRSAARAISDWLYEPQTDDDGAPIEVCGQRVRLDFTFDSETE